MQPLADLRRLAPLAAPASLIAAAIAVLASVLVPSPAAADAAPVRPFGQTQAQDPSKPPPFPAPLLFERRAGRGFLLVVPAAHGLSRYWDAAASRSFPVRLDRIDKTVLLQASAACGRPCQIEAEGTLEPFGDDKAYVPSSLKILFDADGQAPKPVGPDGVALTASCSTVPDRRWRIVCASDAKPAEKAAARAAVCSLEAGACSILWDYR